MLAFCLILFFSACRGEEKGIVMDAREKLEYIGLTVEEISQKMGGELKQVENGPAYCAAKPQRLSGGEYTFCVTVGSADQEIDIDGRSLSAPAGTADSFYYSWQITSPTKEQVLSLNQVVKEAGEIYGEPITYRAKSDSRQEIATAPEELWKLISEKVNCGYWEEWMVNEEDTTTFTLIARYNREWDTLGIQISYRVLPASLRNE